jgi:hypothetical protein
VAIVSKAGKVLSKNKRRVELHIGQVLTASAQQQILARNVVLFVDEKVPFFKSAK